MIKRACGSIAFLRRVFALCVLGWAISLVASTEAQAAVGRTAGNYAVSATGAATYSIPIFTPPGPRGVQPSISLTYSSSAGSGTLGRGWGLAGFSSIHRCNKTIAQDGAASSALAFYTDAYCLDGNRLRHQSESGSYGQNASVYYTELANFSHITANASGYSDSGPFSWTVKGKDGLIYTYGGTSDSRVSLDSYPSWVLEWKLSEITDRSGNKVLFKYKAQDATTTNTTHPIYIEWTQSSAGSGSYIYRMNFNYEADGNHPASLPYGYQAGWRYKDSDLLSSITVTVSGTVKRNYVLAYETSPTTGVKRLIQVKECSDGGPSPSDCLAPTNIAYQNGSVGVNVSSPVLSVSNYVDSVSGDYDFNGDGIKDLVYRDMGSSGSGNGTTIHLGTGSGYGSAISLAYAAGIGKLLGNSSDQLLIASGGYWYVYAWNGSSFSAISTSISTTSMGVDSVLDVNGDGLDDVVWMQFVNYSNADDGYLGILNVYVRKNTTTGGSPSFAAAVHSWGRAGEEYLAYMSSGFPPGYGIGAVITGASMARGGDSDGDGRYDINLTVSMWLNAYDTSNYLDAYWFEGPTALSAAVSFPANLLINVGSGFSDTQNQTALGDLNGDGCDDYLIYDPAYGSGAGVSNCAGGVGEVYPSIWWGQHAGLADWNGDGKSDFFQNDGTTLWVRSVTGNGLTTAVDTGLPATCAAIVRADMNGDGLDDIVCDHYGAGLTVYQHNGVATIPDLATRFEDGYGVRNDSVYKSISQSGIHTPSTNAALPYRDITKGVVVVSKATASDGIGGTYDTDYTYAGAREHTEGRGFMGFEKIEAVDSRAQGLKRVRTFRRDFPYAGMLAEESIYQHDGTTLMSQRAITLGVNTLDTATNNQRYFPYLSSSNEDFYEVGGTKNGYWIARVSLSNTFDGSGNLTSSTKTKTDKDSSSPLYTQSWVEATAATISANTTYWCLGLPTASTTTLTSSVSGETTVTRSKSFTPDYVNCRMDAESVEPSSSTLRVDTAYTYGDSFGNVTSVAVTGRNPNTSSMSTRTSTVSYGTTGQFPVSETNALSQTTTRTFHSTFGSLLTETDPNSIVVATNTYDSFGRVSRATRADGTSTVYTYYYCAIYTCESATDIFGVLASERDTSDSQIRDTWTHYDIFDRPWITDSRDITGSGLSRQWRQYDALGRVKYEGFPCATGSCVPAWPTNTNVVTNSYDLLGRISTQSRPQSQSLSTPVTTTFAYEGRTQTVTDPNSKVTTKILDVNGRMRRSQDHNGYYQSFIYDGAGSLLKVTDSLSNDLFKNVTYEYGIRAFQTYMTDMDLGSWSYTYNSLGELVSWSDAKSQSFSQTFDALSRPVTRYDTVENVTTTWTWGDGTQPGGHNIGNLAGVSMPGYAETLSYDSVGRPSTRSITTDQTYDIDYAYTNQGLLDTLTFPTSTSSTRVKVKYGYAYGLLQSVTDWTSGSAGTIYWTANTQNVRGQTTQETLGNGVVTNRSFDAVTGWLSSIQSAVGGTNLQNHSYAYDTVGNVTQRQDTRISGGLTENFYYDNLYRLDYSQLNSTTNLDLTYDAMGNITNRTDVNGNATWTYHGTKKHAVATTGSGGASYSYDANGNMTSRNGQSISWSSFNYPTTLNTATETTNFYYGPDRQYYKQVYTGPSYTETTHYVGGLLEKVYNSSTGVTDWRHSITADGQVVAIVSRKSSGTNAVNYPLEDNQGSLSVMTNSSGGNIARASYEAYGLPRDGGDWSGAMPSGDKTIIEGITRRGYTGHTMLGDMGLIHMNGRVQDSITGRFLSPDPFVFQPGFTQGYNRYAYVNNNPLTYIDPSGFQLVNQGGAQKTCQVIDWLVVYAMDDVILLPNGKTIRRPNGTIITDYAGSTLGGCWTTWSEVEQKMKPKDWAAVQKAEVKKAATTPQGHDYRTTPTLVCRRALADSERRDLVSRFTVPSALWFGARGVDRPGLHAVTWYGLPGGVVETTYSPDGFTGTNVTTWAHVFQGRVDRSAVNIGGRGYMTTHGFRTAPMSEAPLPNTSYEMFPPFPMDWMLDAYNQGKAPEIFSAYDQRAREYAQANFEGC